MMDDIGLVYTGRITEMENIHGADFINCATVICGKGGKWKGVVRKSNFVVGTAVTVYLPDALITEQHANLFGMGFLRSSNYRVKMQRFKGAPSEVVIMPLQVSGCELGFDCTELLGVKKYYKPIPSNMHGKMIAEFPTFIPKTDEPNYQNGLGQVYLQSLHGKPFYISEKADGASTTAYKYKGHFGVCSRNWELDHEEKNGYWEVANKYHVKDRLPEGFALQWETCGAGINGNNMGLKVTDGFAFSAYNIEEKKYLTFKEFRDLCRLIDFPMCQLLWRDESFNSHEVHMLGEGTYKNGKQREGVVVRSLDNALGHKPISFKVINLNYEK